MLMGFIKPLLEEIEVLDANDASDPMGTVCSLADAGMVTDFLANGITAVGGMGEGIDFSGVMPPAPNPAPAPAAAPTVVQAGLNTAPGLSPNLMA